MYSFESVELHNLHYLEPYVQIRYCKGWVKVAVSLCNILVTATQRRYAFTIAFSLTSLSHAFLGFMRNPNLDPSSMYSTARNN